MKTLLKKIVSDPGYLKLSVESHRAIADLVAIATHLEMSLPDLQSQARALQSLVRDSQPFAWRNMKPQARWLISEHNRFAGAANA